MRAAGFRSGGVRVPEVDVHLSALKLQVLSAAGADARPDRTAQASRCERTAGLTRLVGCSVYQLGIERSVKVPS